VYWRKDGTSFTVEYAASPIRDVSGRVTGAVVTFRDISERRAVERMKDEFVSVVSHELRTPLTSIRGSLGLMQSGRLGEMPEKAERMLDIAVSNTDRLVRLINDILDIERMQSGRVTLARSMCSVAQLTSRAIDLMKPAAEKADVELRSVACGAMVNGDADRLLQTLSNLLSNAIKFSPPGAVVTLTSAVRDAGVLFEVEDHGRGIPADKLDLIFERFQQVDASDSREKGGTGLGLAICRTIVRQHGGEIWVESETGKGSRFRFTVPHEPPSETFVVPAGQTAAAGLKDPSGNAKVLPLVEGNGHRGTAAGSGKEQPQRVSSGSLDNVTAKRGAQSHAA
jgi:signal transduction histidine kinase